MRGGACQNSRAPSPSSSPSGRSVRSTAGPTVRIPSPSGSQRTRRGRGARGTRRGEHHVHPRARVRRAVALELDRPVARVDAEAHAAQPVDVRAAQQDVPARVDGIQPRLDAELPRHALHRLDGHHRDRRRAVRALASSGRRRSRARRARAPRPATAARPARPAVRRTGVPPAGAPARRRGTRSPRGARAGGRPSGNRTGS